VARSFPNLIMFLLNGSAQIKLKLFLHHFVYTSRRRSNYHLNPFMGLEDEVWNSQSKKTPT
jgi:hypothetical protein